MTSNIYKKLLFIVLLCTLHTWGNNLQKAYNFYRTYAYDSAVVYYEKALQENDTNSTIYLGLINSYIELERFLEAHNKIKQIDQKQLFKNNSYILEKKAYLYARNNLDTKVKAVYRDYCTLIDSSSDKKNQHYTVLSNIAYGFYYTKRYKKALFWFTKALTHYPTVSHLKTMIQWCQFYQANMYKQNATLQGAYIHFSEKGSLKRAFVYGGKGAFINQDKTIYTLSLSQTKLLPRYNERYFGYKITDTLLTKPENGICDSFMVSPGEWLYYPLQQEEINSPNEIGYKYIITEKNEILTQNQILFSVSNKETLLPHTNIQIGLNLLFSDIFNSKNAISLFGKHITTKKNISGGAFYNFSILDSCLQLQISPEISYKKNTITSTFITHISKIIDSQNRISQLPSWQASYSLTLSYSKNRFKGTLNGIFGKQQFQMLGDGTFLNNTTIPSLFGMSTIIEYKLSKNKPLWIFYSLGISVNKEYNTYSNNGGVFYQW